jgi:hypothetical protein
MINGFLLLRKTPFYNISCINIAFDALSKDFIAHNSVQNILDHIWNGRITQSYGSINVGRKYENRRNNYSIYLFLKVYFKHIKWRIVGTVFVV